MTRGGARVERDGPERRCVASGQSGETGPLIRFALDPEGVVTPDLAERLPGRGVWVRADRALLERAARRNLFSRGFRRPATVPPALVETVESGLARRLIEALGLVNKAGLVTLGYEKVRAKLKAGPVAALVEASDGSAPQRAKLRPLAAEAVIVDALDSAELGLAFGREFVIHAAVDRGEAAQLVLREARRLAGLRATAAAGATSTI
jgi:predicted RNA-binding protein YlxR (DUF448 family)